MKKLRARLTYANVMATIAAVAALGALGGPAVAGPIADMTASVGKKVARALKLSKSADKRSKEALKLAQRVQQQGGQGSQGAPGAKGDRGDKGEKGNPGAPGSDAQFNGAAAGGSLTGTYPNPSIAPDAVTGARVQDLSLSSDDLANGAITASKLGTLTVRTASVTLDATGQVEGNGSYDTAAVSKTCNFQEQAIAVGGSWGLSTSGVHTDEELTTTNIGFLVDVTTGHPGGGHARVGNNTSASHTFTLQVVCLSG